MGTVMSFHVGQKVVRIPYEKDYSSQWASQGAALTVVGQIYVIRSINDFPTQTLLRFEGLDNTHLTAATDGLIEPGFNALAFRPLAERKTDIGALTALLIPVNHKKREPA